MEEEDERYTYYEDLFDFLRTPEKWREWDLKEFWADAPVEMTKPSVIEELDRIEEFLNWVSFIFADGSSYEGTVWDDLAHGKGVYVAEQGLVRYEGEWLQNNMEGHGVVEVEIPT
ncbi:hypothetical protein HAX54_010052 [Datura stramonium]|uniref:Uncharacterized protein n=1 Tax=Datura stramonium TaxID=4076 RepID=A0ABS8TGL8_DATST|nr:hypothetical protein [Datura stramonium]